MSFFDPYHISEYDGYYSKKGQVIQKRHVDRNPALNLKDKERAIKILNAFGYKAIKDDYMPLEKYNYFAGRTLSYTDFGQLGPGESFQIKLNNLLSFLTTLPIMTQVSYNNVVELNIEMVLNSIYFRCTSDQNVSYLIFKIGEGIYQYNVNITQSNGFSLKTIIFPDIDNGYVNHMDIRGSTSSLFQKVSAPNATRGQLAHNNIEGDKYLFNAILHNDFSDARFDINVVEIINNTEEAADVLNLTELGIYFAVDVEVIYKTYID